MSPQVEAPNSVILVVGSEQFSVPRSFGGGVCAATNDCIAVGVRSVDDGSTWVEFTPSPAPEGMLNLGEFQIESEGELSVRDIYNRGLESVGVTPGLVSVTIWGDDPDEPEKVLVQVADAS